MNAIYRWDPFQGLSTLLEGNFDASRETPSPNWSPAVDIYETEGELVVKADLPDLNEKDIDIRIENNNLTLRGERKFEQTVNKDNYVRVERAHGTFERSFKLPNTVNTEGIEANYHNGLLTIHLPKREELKPKQIKVGVSTQTGSKK